MGRREHEFPDNVKRDVKESQDYRYQDAKERGTLARSVGFRVDIRTAEDHISVKKLADDSEGAKSANRRRSE